MNKSSALTSYLTLAEAANEICPIWLNRKFNIYKALNLMHSKDHCYRFNECMYIMIDFKI